MSQSGQWEEAGSFAGSEHHEEESEHQADSVNNGQAQSPVSCMKRAPSPLCAIITLTRSPSMVMQRVPRSQISRAHPGGLNAGLGERTSAVLSGLSGDDETALSAAEAAGDMKSFRLVVMMPAHPPPSSSCHFCWCSIIWVFNSSVVPLGFCFRRAYISTQA